MRLLRRRRRRDQRDARRRVPATIPEGLAIALRAGASLHAGPAPLAAAGTVAIATNATLHLTNGGDNLAAKTCEEATLPGASFSDGRLLVDIDPAAGAADLFHFGAQFAATGKINVALSSPFPLRDWPRRYVFMTAPASAQRLTPADFDTSSIVFDTEDGLDPNGILVVEAAVCTDASGLQSVSLHRTNRRMATMLLLR